MLLVLQWLLEQHPAHLQHPVLLVLPELLVLLELHPEHLALLEHLEHPVDLQHLEHPALPGLLELLELLGNQQLPGHLDVLEY